MDLIERLLALAKLWAAANDRSLSRLATMVVNDGKLFDRLTGGSSCTVTTFERFIDFLNEDANWRTGIPGEARKLLDSVLMVAGHADANSATAALAAPGKSDNLAAPSPPPETPPPFHNPTHGTDQTAPRDLAA